MVKLASRTQSDQVGRQAEQRPPTSAANPNISHGGWTPAWADPIAVPLAMPESASATVALDAHAATNAAEEILGLAQRGNVLIKGWGAATLLREVPQVISVRVCAPMEFRVHVMMERLGREDADTVREEIERFDAARARTLRAYFNVEQEDVRLYHIVVNTERLSVDACVNAVCKLAEGTRFRDTFTSRSAMANKHLEAKISSALVEHISVAMAPLGVSVSVANGKVTLAGTTCSGSLRKRAEKVTHAVAGAFQIDNRIISVPTRGSAF
jgi:cytidylate kinase